jgi:hypothetical protein
MGTSSHFWLATELRTWIASPTASLLLLEGSFIRRDDTRDLSLDLIQLALSVNMPAIWYFSTPNQNVSLESTVDAIRSLIQQIVKQNKERFSSSKLDERNFRACNTITDWLVLLATVISNVPHLLIVVEAHDTMSQTLDLWKQFWGEIVKQNVTTLLKVLVVTCKVAKKTTSWLPTTEGQFTSYRLNLNRNQRPGTARRSLVPQRGRARGSFSGSPQSLRPFMIQLLETEFSGTQC